MSLNKFLFFILIVASTFSCSNELVIAADWKSIPVIYALVDMGEEVNYFRVEKAFLDPEISGEIIAQNPDSLYYGSEVQVRLTNMDNDKSVILERVNLEDEGFEREEGSFATTPNIGYKLTVADLEMDSDASLKLELIDENDSVMTEALSSVVGPYTIVASQPVDPARFIEDRDASFGIRSDEQAARFYDCRVIINYDEEDINVPGVLTTKSLLWEVETGLLRAASTSTSTFQSLSVFKVSGEEFFIYIGSNIEENTSIKRYFKGLDLEYAAGGEELLNYINIGLANTGITSNQIIPTYTNFNNDAVGVFSSRSFVKSIESYGINTETRDSLRDGRFTKSLNFN